MLFFFITVLSGAVWRKKLSYNERKGEEKNKFSKTWKAFKGQCVCVRWSVCFCVCCSGNNYTWMPNEKDFFILCAGDLNPHTRVNFFLKISLLAPSFGPVTCSNHDLLKIQFMTAVMSPLLFFLCTFFRSHFKCYLRLPLSSLWHLSVRTQTSLVSFFVPVCFFVFKTFVWDK